MALADFHVYYNKLTAQYLEMKQDIVDLNKDIKEKNLKITEEQLASIKEQFAEIEKNYTRCTYIAYLLELPRDIKKQDRFKKSNKDLLDFLKATQADVTSVTIENESAIALARKNIDMLLKSLD